MKTVICMRNPRGTVAYEVNSFSFASIPLPHVRAEDRQGCSKVVIFANPLPFPPPGSSVAAHRGGHAILLPLGLLLDCSSVISGVNDASIVEDDASISGS